MICHTLEIFYDACDGLIYAECLVYPCHEVIDTTKCGQMREMWSCTRNMNHCTSVQNIIHYEV